ncbi:uncharacterized protein [Parasteatoda tepidariorum]|uniref:uncharacterized protein n=1 Tax=Parasteatoda tepidariorum TaxID=114398 RepID=UPI0039BCA728
MTKIVKISFLWHCTIICFAGLTASFTIEVPKCSPPDFPMWGGYGPIQSDYDVGDSIHYFCNTDTYIGGNYYRRCEDSGEWSGDTPVCDEVASITFVNQTSTAEPEEENDADLATDEDRTTCTSTAAGQRQYWMGIFKDPGELIRVMVFMPRGDVSYEVLLLKRNGSVLSCGEKRGRNGHLGWEFHNCPGPHNKDAMGIKIISLSPKPLQICEIAAHVMTSPTCVDPHLRIDDGLIQLTRKTASLRCKPGYTESSATRLECVRNGVWNKKSLFCIPPPWEAVETHPRV